MKFPELDTERTLRKAKAKLAKAEAKLEKAEGKVLVRRAKLEAAKQAFDDALAAVARASAQNGQRQPATVDSHADEDDDSADDDN